MKNLRTYLIPLLLLFCITTTTYAQEHMKFMGIPLTGTIDNFQQKLAAKGVYVDKEGNATAGFGMRVFKGKFCGQNCSIAIYYTDKKIVYRAKAFYMTETESLADQYHDDVKSLLQTKYADEMAETSTDDEYEVFRVYPTTTNGETLLGEIDLWKKEDEVSYRTTYYSIHIDYWDYANQRKYTQEKLDDL